MILPGIVLSATMLALMIVHMETLITRLCAKPVFSLYPQSQSGQGAIFFPYTIQGTNLVIESMVPYSGPFWEDGSGDNVIGIAALTLHNGGTRPLTSARIEIQQGTRFLVFQAQTILPGDTLLVLEANKQCYEQIPCTCCKGYVIPDETVATNDEDLQITLSQENLITVTNRTDRYLTDICVEYKHWRGEYGIYVGGSTFKIMMGDLAPGQSISTRVERFIESNSRIVRVTFK